MGRLTSDSKLPNTARASSGARSEPRPLSGGGGLEDLRARRDCSNVGGLLQDRTAAAAIMAFVVAGRRWLQGVDYPQRRWKANITHSRYVPAAAPLIVHGDPTGIYHYPSLRRCGVCSRLLR